MLGIVLICVGLIYVANLKSVGHGALVASILFLSIGLLLMIAS